MHSIKIHEDAGSLQSLESAGFIVRSDGLFLGFLRRTLFEIRLQFLAAFRGVNFQRHPQELLHILEAFVILLIF